MALWGLTLTSFGYFQIKPAQTKRVVGWWLFFFLPVSVAKCLGFENPAGLCLSVTPSLGETMLWCNLADSPVNWGQEPTQSSLTSGQCCRNVPREARNPGRLCWQQLGQSWSSPSWAAGTAPLCCVGPSQGGVQPQAGLRGTAQVPKAWLGGLGLWRWLLSCKSGKYSYFPFLLFSDLSVALQQLQTYSRLVLPLIPMVVRPAEQDGVGQEGTPTGLLQSSSSMTHR